MRTETLQQRRSAPSRLALWYIETYRTRVAPRLQVKCHFEPSCSAYGLAAYQQYGFLRATAKTIWRLLRCNPLRRATGIYDPA